MLSQDDVIDVAVAVIRDAQGRILVNERQVDKEHAGHWEFPGGKFALDETASLALRRECKEELGIEIIDDEPFMELTHEYPGKTVRLHVRLVNAYENIPRSMEQQVLAWLSLKELKELKRLLPADRPILVALEVNA